MNIFLSMFTLTPVTTLFYLHRGLSYTEIFILAMVFGVGKILFEVPTGMLADKIGRKWSLILGILTFLVHYIIYFFAHGLFEMIIGFLVMVLGVTFISGTVEAFVYDSLKFCKRVKDMKKEYGKYLSAKTIPSFFIPFIAAWLAQDLLNWQFQLLISISIIASIIGLVIALTLKEPEHEAKEKPSSFALLSRSVFLFKTNIDFRRIFFNEALILAPFQIFWRIWQPYLTDLATPVILLGVIVATHNIATFFFQRHAHALEEKFGMERLIFVTSALPFVGYLLLLFTRNMYVAIFGIYLIFIFTVGRRPLISDYLNSHISSDKRATALSMLNMLQGLFQLVLFGIVAYITIYSDFIGLYVAAGLVFLGLLFFRLNGGHVAKNRA